MPLTGFKNSTLIGKNDTTVSGGFAQKTPQDNVTVFEYTREPEQYLHPTAALATQTSDLLEKIIINTKKQIFTSRDIPVSSTKVVPTTEPSLGIYDEPEPPEAI